MFRGTSVSIKNDLINSVADVTKNEIFNEIINVPTIGMWQLCLTKHLTLEINRNYLQF